MQQNRSAKPPTYNTQLESYLGPGICSGRIMEQYWNRNLPLNDVRKSIFFGQIATNSFGDIKNSLCANPLVQAYSLQKTSHY